MRLKLIACKALFRELSYICAMSENAVDITWMRQGFHNHPDQLRELLQKEIDLVESGEDPHSILLSEDMNSGGVEGAFDAILLGYGLCSNATAGLHAARHTLVIPRAHDCITLLLGSKERYNRYFTEWKGCFWYAGSWIENANMPCERSHERNAQRYRDMGYDDETIDYLLNELGGLDNYKHAACITVPFLNNERYTAMTQAAADFYGWEYHELPSDLSLMERMIAGHWDDKDFLVLKPGETAVQTGGADVITAKAIS